MAAPERILIMNKGPFGHRVQPTKSADQRGGGASSQTAADLVIRFSEVVNSTLNNRTKAVQLAVTGVDGEHVDDAEPHQSLGMLGRPLPPRRSRAGEQHTDVVCIVTADGLVPIAFRDPRLKMGGDSPGVGVLAFVGYGGGFMSHTPVPEPNPIDPRNIDPAGGGTISVLYCPYDFDSSGVAQKAHAVILDPTPGNQSISLVHADGMAITMLSGDKNALVLKNKAGDATFRLDDDGITMTAPTVTINAGVIIGDAASAVPLLPGVASPGSTKLYVSP